jgi:hypothetical protein
LQIRRKITGFLQAKTAFNYGLGPASQQDPASHPFAIQIAAPARIGLMEGDTVTAKLLRIERAKDAMQRSGCRVFWNARAWRKKAANHIIGPARIG